MFYVETTFPLVAIAVSLCLVLVISLCLCGCRKEKQKNDFMGLTGMVKITNPDDLLNQDTLLRSPAVNTTIIEDQPKRLKINANPHRSLPDIPICSENNAQHAEIPEVVTELYATVGDKVCMDSGPALRPEIPSSSNRLSATHHILDSNQDDATSSYATVSNFDHTYNRVQIPDHPYAQVQSSRHKTTSTGSSSNALPSTQNSNIDILTPSAVSDSEHSIVDIPAAPAIAGRVSANQELPYMTPPIQNNHFSGDSQDSSKGYTSISVREPLINILVHANQNSSRTNAELIDSHYTTVSDDSDEMYAAIEEQPFSPFEVYTSVSDTYAQIHLPSEQPTPMPYTSNITPDVTLNNNVPEVKDAVGGTTSNAESIVQQVLQVHARQDSSSSCVSSVGNLESPKPVKRQANSPLPLPPSNTINLAMNKQLNYNDIKIDSYNNQQQCSETDAILDVESDVIVNGNISSLLNSLECSDGKNQNLNLILSNNSEITGAITDLEGMYAKVIKKHKLMMLKNDAKLNNINESDAKLKLVSETDEMSNSNELNSTVLPQEVFNKIRNSETKSINNLELPNEEKDPGYETICDKKTLQDTNSSKNVINNDSYRLNINTIPDILQTFNSDSKNDGDPNYEELNLPGFAISQTDGYSTVPEPTSIKDSSNQIKNEIKSASEHNYEPVTQSNAISDLETNYDSIKSINNSNSVPSTCSVYQCEETQTSKKAYSAAVDDYFQV